MKEKEFTFLHPIPATSTTGEIPKQEKFTVKESELTATQQDLLLGNLIMMWQNASMQAQQRFLQMLSEATRGKHMELFGNLIEPFNEKK